MTADDATPDQDEKIDEALEETFPASDAPANTVETGIRAPNPAAPPVSDNRELKRFEINVDGHIAFLAYHRTPDTLTLVHTEVPEALRGRHLGGVLIDTAVDAGHAGGLHVAVMCPFAREYLRKKRRSDVTLL